jgi:hypothetical protein
MQPGQVISVTPNGQVSLGTPIIVVVATRPGEGNGHGHGDGQGNQGGD